MIDIDKIHHVLTKLIADTRRGKMQWESIPKNRLGDDFLRSDDVHKMPLGQVYGSKYKGKFFRIYKYQFLTSEDGYLYYNALRCNLEMTDESFENLAWIFPHRSEIEDLYELVSFKASGAEAFIDDLMKDLDIEESA